ncbi:hypothetical protein HK103_001984 [Boothiomyces macroporosus]|uniref:BRCA1-associated protein n=1 Tax=Boothiomyces macroporosus TaxID=261099 RepID=A0AAD5U9U0_9FUNG|nr:hypothetical protein HK103_001984 [Boothiomyces macroporosus]
MFSLIIQKSTDWRFGKITMKFLEKESFVLDSKTNGTLTLFKHKTTELKNTLAILAVPYYISPQDFLKLLGHHRQNLLHLRTIQDSVPNRYVIILKFDCLENADSFYSEFNGKLFNSFEAETCHVVYVKDVFFKEGDQLRNVNLVDNIHGLFTGSEGSPQLEQSSSSTDLQKQDNDPLKDTLELPTCPVCLERLDANVTGLFTSLCQHTFHCQCIMKWGDVTCPVCRFSTIKLGKETVENSCSECQSTENLWICLICGNVGCGRYVQAHASKHYTESNHVYSLELETQRVWDYVGDEYVHRLIQNKSDGKIVHLPSASETVKSKIGLDVNESSIITPADFVVAEKLDLIDRDYSEMIKTQLNNQREMYEKQINKMELKMIDLMSNFESKIETLEINLKKKDQQQEIQSNLIKEYQHTVQTQQKKLDKLQEKNSTLSNSLNEEKQINQNLLLNMNELKTMMENLKKELLENKAENFELKEQVRDLMFFIDTKEKVKDSELDMGTVVGVSAPATPNTEKKKKKKK